MSGIELAKIDFPEYGGAEFAPGHYFCKCADCGTQFGGAKRPYQCPSCAVKSAATPKPILETQILKYRLSPEWETTVAEGRVVVCAFQHGEPTVWIEVNVGECRTQELRLFGTGWVFDRRNHQHVGSCVSDAFVWHVYRKVNP